MTANGQTIKQMVRVFIHIKMELYILEIGLKINNMVKDVKHGQTAQNMKVSMMKAESMGQEHYILQMGPGIKVILTIMISKELEHIDGLMIEDMMENGFKIKCKELVKQCGQTVEFIKANILMIKKMGMVDLLGQISESMKDIGKMVNSMAQVYIFHPLEKRNMENGRTEED